MDDVLLQLLGRSPTEVCDAGLSAIANRLIEEGVIHICGKQILWGKSKIHPPLLVACSTKAEDVNSLAEFLST